MTLVNENLKIGVKRVHLHFCYSGFCRNPQNCVSYNIELQLSKNNTTYFETQLYKLATITLLDKIMMKLILFTMAICYSQASKHSFDNHVMSYGDFERCSFGLCR